MKSETLSRVNDVAIRPVSSRNQDSAGRRVHVIQGQHHVASDPDVILTTILGSCVAACLRDPVVGVGGMNHFLLPGETGGAGSTDRSCNSLRYGVHAMELLVNGLLQRGAERFRLQAKLFGGARMMKGLTDIGEMNASFAEKFLLDEGIMLVGGSLRGCRGRRIQFWPVCGRARQVFMGTDNLEILREEGRPPANISARPGEVDLF